MLLTANIFQPLIDVFEAVLKFFHNSLGIPWGWAIVLLTVAIRVILVPLFVKQFHSMQALQRLQPEMKALQNKYKDDKQRQQQELMKFYRENNVNPLGSCLPIVLQLPVFISLYYMLRQSLRKDICPAIQTHFQEHYAAVHKVSHAVAAGQTTPCGHSSASSFLFIHDLTDKATGITLVVLIVLYVGTQLASSLLMQSPTMDPTQRRIMLLMPLFFVLFIISFPSGVIVYWITTNAWTMAQQYLMRRRLGPLGPPAVAEGTSTGGTGGDGGRPPRGGGGGDGGDGVTGGAGGLNLGGLLRGKPKDAEVVAAESRRARTAAPPPPPRKKKKRSGRRR
jgi:YidC/Oxa1 family membrane protein insertase